MRIPDYANPAANACLAGPRAARVSPMGTPLGTPAPAAVGFDLATDWRADCNGRMRYRAVIFDMDGTLTRPRLDFPAIKREIGIPADRPILEAMEHMDDAARQRAERIVSRHEEHAARHSELNDGAAALVAFLRRRGVPLGLITRNNRRSVEITCRRHGLAFEAIISRDDAAPKPSPDGVLKVCRMLGVQPAEACVVGDYAFDIDSGRAAGCRTLAILNGKRPDWADRADACFDSPRELLEHWKD
jgi:HAD superfamily hydrolase (TIGR01509 family)